MRPASLAPMLLAAALLAPVAIPTAARAEDRIPGEATELTDKVRADALKQVEVIVKGPGDPVAARRVLLRMGPVVWPVLDNALRLTPPDAARPHLLFLKALLVKKAEPEFEALRGKLRRRFLIDDMKGISADLTAFRLGLPDPANPGKRLPLSVKSTRPGSTELFRSADGTILLGFGADGTDKKPDAPDASATDPMAGFVAVVAGKGAPYDRQSGKGGDASATADNGFAWAWAADGAPGKGAGGAGGQGGSALPKGGAGQWGRSGDGGPGGPG
ncbi:MAG: hypothetical protein IT460_09820 [Planctomycetes bacterium]|nr:hypothetical protein [Planctomycetota bacterium]